MQLRTYLGLVAFVSGAAIVPAACAPDSNLPPAADPGAGGASSGSGAFPGVGGALFETGPGCVDTSDPDGDLVANLLELAAEDADTDGDATADAQDTDSDGDGVLDAVEAVNPLLPLNTQGQMRDDPCDPLADTDSDGAPDVRDLDSDNDGVPDAQEAEGDCRVLIDCDDDGVIDVIEQAAGTDPTDPKSAPADPGLYFVLPYLGGPQHKDFSFSAGVAKADIYFLVDVTASMQPAIDALKASISTSIIPAILNGDPQAAPPIPAISDAWVGVGAVGDVPVAPYGQPSDDVYRYRFGVGPGSVLGNVQPPLQNGGSFVAPANVASILGSLDANGGGDGPEATTQALWMAATGAPYAVNNAVLWNPAQDQPPYPPACPESGMFGVPCFRPGSLPIFVVVTDAAMHNGPAPQHLYDGLQIGGTRTYADTVAALNAIDAKIVGVPVAGANPNVARADLNDLATKTGSLWHDPAFGGNDRPLVPEVDVTTGQVSSEVVQLLGLLAGAGLHDVTTRCANYDCSGGVDCTGDGTVDPAYHNPEVAPATTPFDASELITSIEPIASDAAPPPYAALDATTFYGVRGAAEVKFRVFAENDSVKTSSLLVMRALVRVTTPADQLLGGKKGVRLVYFVIPPYVEQQT